MTNKGKKGRAHHQTNLYSGHVPFTDVLIETTNLLRKWDQTMDTGFALLSQVCNLKLSLLGQVTDTSDFANSDNSYYNEDLSLLCHKLVQNLAVLQGIVDQFQTVCTKLLKHNQLNESYALSHDKASEHHIPYYIWSISDIYSSISSLLNMLVKQLEVNKAVVKNSAHVDLFIRDHSDNHECILEDCKHILMTYTSIWLHQPYINNNVKKEVLDNIIRYSS